MLIVFYLATIVRHRLIRGSARGLTPRGKVHAKFAKKRERSVQSKYSLLASLAQPWQLSETELQLSVLFAAAKEDFRNEAKFTQRMQKVRGDRKVKGTKRIESRCI